MVSVVTNMAAKLAMSRNSTANLWLSGICSTFFALPGALALPDLDVSLTDCQQRREEATRAGPQAPVDQAANRRLAEDWEQAFNQTIPARARQRGLPEDQFFLATYDQDNLGTAVAALQSAVRQKPEEPLFLYMASLLCRRVTSADGFCQVDHISKAARISDNGFYASQAALSAYQKNDQERARRWLTEAATSDYYQSVYGHAAVIYFQVISQHARDLAWLSENMRVVTAMSLAMSQGVPALQSMTQMCLPDRRPVNPDSSDCLHLAQLMTTDRSSLLEANIGFAIWQGILGENGDKASSNENLKLQRQVGRVMQLSRRSAAMSCVLEGERQGSAVTAAYLHDLATLGEIAAIEKQLDVFEASHP
jgi:hypothetical protein